MKKVLYFFIAIMLLQSFSACKKFLDETPQGTISSEDLNNANNLEKLVNTTYASLAEDPSYLMRMLTWGYDLRSGDAHKGGAGLSDLGNYHAFEIFITNQSDNFYLDDTWTSLYGYISEANEAMTRINAVNKDIFPLKETRLGELHFLRGVYYYQLKTLFKHIPWIDENLTTDAYDTVSNRQYGSDELWSKIAGDFRTAIDLLPESQPEIGRANKYAAKAYLAKVLLNQAYTQDEETHALRSIDASKLEEVVALCDELIPQYQLFNDFGYNFLTAYDNGSESIFAIQFSMNDGTSEGNGGFGFHGLYPMNAEYGCCGLYVPSQNLINAFKTDANGLPMFDTYDQGIVDQAYEQNHTVDPRLNHTAAIPGNPFKYEPDFIYQESWARAATIYGASAPLKELVSYKDPTYRKFPFGSAKNWPLIRLADVILWKAEALIQLDRWNEALPLINQIRRRAANSTDMLKRTDGSFIARYKVGEYQPGINCVWDKDFAFKALMWERRLELSLEFGRFTDLVRWGIADTYLNAYFKTESARRAYLKDAKFTKGRDEYLPIPQNQINFSKGLYKQNHGY